MSECILEYGEHPLQKIKQFCFNSEYKISIILIHGGAWRDPNNTYDDFAVMAQHLINSSIPVNIFSINYRLSPEIKHPFHLLDILYAFKYLNQNFNLGNVQILGHSVGATLALQLLNFDDIITWGFKTLVDMNDASTNRIPTAEGLMELFLDISKLNITKVFLLDGIFDNLKLIEEYGAPYKEFVDNAFISEEQYKNASQLSTIQDLNIYQNFKSAQIHILYSKEDELLSENQTNELQGYLDRNQVGYIIDKGFWGKHEDVYKSLEVSKIIGSSIH